MISKDNTGRLCADRVTRWVPRNSDPGLILAHLVFPVCIRPSGISPRTTVANPIYMLVALKLHLQLRPYWAPTRTPAYVCTYRLYLIGAQAKLLISHIPK